MAKKVICGGCNKVIPYKLQGDPHCKAVGEGEQWHRACALRLDPQYGLMDRLFNMQDEPDIDPETALADLIGNLGHFATLKKIDFEEAVRRGLGYWQDERLPEPARRRKKVHPVDTKEEK